MAIQSVTVHLPDELYSRVQLRAQEARHSLEDELVSALDRLTLLDDADLWRAARSHLASADAKRLESLHLKRQRVGLDGAEEGEQAQLTRAYERFMLIRAQAASLLIQP